MGYHVARKMYRFIIYDRGKMTKTSYGQGAIIKCEGTVTQLRNILAFPTEVSASDSIMIPEPYI